MINGIIRICFGLRFLETNRLWKSQRGKLTSIVILCHTVTFIFLFILFIKIQKKNIESNFSLCFESNDLDEIQTRHLRFKFNK